MNLESLKSSWRIYKLQNTQETWDERAILKIIEDQPIGSSYQTYFRVIQNISFFILLIIICQGG